MKDSTKKSVVTTSTFKRELLKTIEHRDNPYHPLVWIHGDPTIGKEVYIGGYSEINASGTELFIGDYCDIGSFVVINCLDSHMRAIEKSFKVEASPIVLEHHVFVGTMSAILGGTYIEHHSVIGSGVVLKGQHIPAYSLVYKDNDSGKLVIRAGYYKDL